LRTWADLTGAQRTWAARQYRQDGHYQTIDRQLDIDPDARDCVYRQVRTWADAQAAAEEYHETHIAEAPECARRWTDHITVAGDHLILADAHIPFHDADWMNRCIDLADKWGIRKVGMAGDLFDQGAFSFYGRQQGVEWRDEHDAAMQAVRALLSRFEQVTISQGNHEVRVIRKIAHALDIADWNDMLYGEIHSPKLNVTPYHWFIVESGGQRYRVTHPRNASITPGFVAAKVAEKYNTHVITSHGHLNGWRRDTSDRLWCIDMGMCADLERLAYVVTEDNTRPIMQQGAVLILDGIPALVTPDNITQYERMAA